MHLYKKKRDIPYWGLILTLGIFILFGGYMYKQVNGISEDMDGSDAKVLKDALDNAVITCYAIEGSYPESLEYIEEHYGIIIDRDKFFVDYDNEFINTRPRISVFTLTEE